MIEIEKSQLSWQFFSKKSFLDALESSTKENRITLSELRKKKNKQKNKPRPNYSSDINSLTGRDHQLNHLHDHFHYFSPQAQCPETS